MMTNFPQLSPGGYEDVVDDIAKNLAANGPYDGLPGGPVCGAAEITSTGCKTSELVSTTATSPRIPATRKQTAPVSHPTDQRH